jgi:hypothetical protein
MRALARMRPWYAQTSFRMAAGLAGAALVGVIGFRAMQNTNESHAIPADGRVARLDDSKREIRGETYRGRGLGSRCGGPRDRREEARDGQGRRLDGG